MFILEYLPNDPRKNDSKIQSSLRLLGSYHLNPFGIHVVPCFKMDFLFHIVLRNCTHEVSVSRLGICSKGTLGNTFPAWLILWVWEVKNFLAGFTPTDGGVTLRVLSSLTLSPHDTAVFVKTASVPHGVQGSESAVVKIFVTTELGKTSGQREICNFRPPRDDPSYRYAATSCSCSQRINNSPKPLTKVINSRFRAKKEFKGKWEFGEKW